MIIYDKDVARLRLERSIFNHVLVSTRGAQRADFIRTLLSPDAVRVV